MFYDDLDEICKLLKRELFCKTVECYKSKKYDSCYVFSTELLLTDLSGRERDAVNYIQGVSAQQKNLYKKALNNFKNISDDYGLIQVRNLMLGSVYLNLKEFGKAIEIYKLWKKSSITTDVNLTKKAYHNFGTSYMHLKEYSEAKKYFDKELKLLDKKDTLSIIRSKTDLANAYYNQYLDAEAIILFKEVYSLAKVFSNLEMKELTADNMAIVEKNRKNFKESIKYYLEYYVLRDSLYNRDRIWELTEKEKQIALAQKQQEIALQGEKLKRQKAQRNGLIVGIGGLLVFLGGLGFFYKKLKSQNTLITKQKKL